MNCPFPGMDPFLEDPALWSDFHSRFINCWCEAIADVLPRNYEARLDQWVQLVELPPLRIKEMEPDVLVSHKGKATRRRNGTAVATLEPVTIPHARPRGRRQGYVKILHQPERSLVTVLELLSPANKKAPGFRHYLNKREAVLSQSVHLVELDMLLGGRRLPLSKPLPRGDYYYMLSRGNHRFECEVFTWTVQDALAKLPVPLRSPDPDCQVDLAAVFATAYERGRYEHSINYTAPPPVTVDPALLASVRKRRRR